MPPLLFATQNPWKASLFAPVFHCAGFDMHTLRDLPANGSPPPETGATALDNALTKARFYHSAQHPWVFGDDAGLEIDALGGEPGVQARRWGGHFPDDVDDQTWLAYLLKRMRGVPPGKRTARFVAGWALIAPDGAAHVREVHAPFQIATRPIRPIAPGSPINAVRLGSLDVLSARQGDIRAEWERWGILEQLQEKST